MTRFVPDGRLRAALAITVALAVLLTAMPTASVSAQGSDARFKAAMQYLQSVPGLKNQLQNLTVTLDPRGDASKDGDAIWAAVGGVTLNKNLRRYFNKLAKGPIGWGTVPEQGAVVLATFTGLVRKTDLKGDDSVHQHNIFGDGGAVTRGPEQDPFETATLVDSFGTWNQDGVGTYPQATSSTASGGVVNWFDRAFVGAGGVDKNVIANVVRVEDVPFGGGGGGGGGNPPGGAGGNPPGGGGNPPGGAGAGNGSGDGGDGSDDADGGAEAGSDDADAGGAVPLVDLTPTMQILIESGESRDSLTWYAGTNFFKSDFVLGNDGQACFNTVSTTLPDGRLLIEVNAQSGRPLDLESLRDFTWMNSYSTDGELLNSVRGEWSTNGTKGMYRGTFILPIPARQLGSVRIAPDERALVAAETAGDAEGEDIAAVVGQMAWALSAAGVAVPGLNGDLKCGTFTAGDLDICDQRIVGAVQEAMTAAGVALSGALSCTRGQAPNGAKQGTLADGGTTVGQVQAPGMPLAVDSLDTAAGASGCDAAKIETERPARYLDCGAFSALLWVADAELAEAVEWLAQDEDEETLLTLLAWQMIFAEGYDPMPPLPEPGTEAAEPEATDRVAGPDEPVEVTKPLGLDSNPITIADTLMDGPESASDGLVWTPAFPPGGANT